MRFCPLSSLRCVDRHQLSTFYSLLLLNSLHRGNSPQLSSKTGFSHGYWGDMIASFALHGWRGNDRTTSMIYTWYVVFACSPTIPMMPDSIGKKKTIFEKKRGILKSDPEKTRSESGRWTRAPRPALTCSMNVGVSPFWKGSINLYDLAIRVCLLAVGWSGNKGGRMQNFHERNGRNQKRFGIYVHV